MNRLTERIDNASSARELEQIWTELDRSMRPATKEEKAAYLEWVKKMQGAVDVMVCSHYILLQEKHSEYEWTLKLPRFPGTWEEMQYHLRQAEKWVDSHSLFYKRGAVDEKAAEVGEAFCYVNSLLADRRRGYVVGGLIGHDWGTASDHNFSRNNEL